MSGFLETTHVPVYNRSSLGTRRKSTPCVPLRSPPAFLASYQSPPHDYGPPWDARSSLQAHAERCQYLERQLAAERQARAESEALHERAAAQVKYELAEQKARAEKKARQCDGLKAMLEDERGKRQYLEGMMRALQEDKGGKESEAVAHERYQQQWDLLTRLKQVLGAEKPILAFADIPWPTFNRPTKPEDITKEEVVKFIEASPTSKLNRKVTKEQLLTWHPDKFCGRWLPYVVERDRLQVQRGTSIVVQLLNEIMREGGN